MRTLVIVVFLNVAGLVGFAVSSEAGPVDAASRECRSVRASGPWGDVRATVNVVRGRVPCRTARAVARTLLNGDGQYVRGRYSYQSYWVVGRWRGGARMSTWVMSRCRRLEGCGRVIRGTFR